jgi:hypothetical protein
MLGVQLLLIMAAEPFAATGLKGSSTVLELVLVAFAFLIVLVSRGPIMTTVAALAVISTLAGSLFNIVAPSTPTRMLAHAGALGGSVVVAYVVGRAVLAPGAVNTHRVFGAIVLYLNFGMLFATGYRLIWDLIPNSLSGVPSEMSPTQASGTIFYFSYVTLTSIGFGDIAPVDPFARGLANLEGIIGQLYPATLLARLVTLELESRPRR